MTNFQYKLAMNGYKRILKRMFLNGNIGAVLEDDYVMISYKDKRMTLATDHISITDGKTHIYIFNNRIIEEFTNPLDPII